ncbi:hypothetical protein B0H34DRAFT_679143 [Crassisporium funariophilum]|nr:hypothetical protein B0H34DRAFT_679143 [Crassisporium funariophilum]
MTLNSLHQTELPPLGKIRDDGCTRLLVLGNAMEDTMATGVILSQYRSFYIGAAETSENDHLFESELQRWPALRRPFAFTRGDRVIGNTRHSLEKETCPAVYLIFIGVTDLTHGCLVPGSDWRGQAINEYSLLMRASGRSQTKVWMAALELHVRAAAPTTQPRNARTKRTGTTKAAPRSPQLHQLPKASSPPQPAPPGPRTVSYLLPYLAPGQELLASRWVDEWAEEWTNEWTNVQEDEQADDANDSE